MEMNEPGSAAKGPRPDPDAALEESMWRLGLGEGSSSYPERPGEPDCSYYVRTGSCNYGERCRYNHPRDRGALTGAGTGRTGAVEYLERADQPVCEHYMKTGTCKFGSTCKYRHPRQGSGSIPPVLLSDCGYPLRPGEKECSYYMKTGHCKFGSTCKFHHPQQAEALVPSPAPAFYSPVQPLSIPSPQQYPPMVTWQFTRPSVFPGSYMPGPYAPMLLSSGVVPVQGWNPYPGAQLCNYYAQHGMCKFGTTCKFDHPMGTLSCSPSASSLSDMPVSPYPIGLSVATWAPSSSSSELQPEFSSSKESFSSKMSFGSTSSGSIGTLFSNMGYLPHLFIRHQTPTSSSGGFIAPGGEISSSS
ncbi:hypothetical protein C4D60_Mb08t09340 [Musa balbisiana]|uniref:C3H1-type domain-containing protein n=1 Tax=Musa balbisiana TaxID=52838 RepID=A0A4S8K2I3_MUSBA|nr:hypothetical protein C4D60_Mb08t09340 [Musa balbisiana]